jgi:hypothetical protein
MRTRLKTALTISFSVHPPGRLRVLWDNPLNDEQYADVVFLPLIARQVEGRNMGTTP